jgi:hypothetical protein
MGLTAYYGSQAWDTTPAEFTHLDDPLPLGVDNPESILLDHPSPAATAGFGWSLHPGGLFEPGSAASVGSGSSNNYYLNVARTTKVSQYWRFIAPDGSTHFFLSSLHGEVPEPPDDVLPPTPCRSTVQNATPCYTRDGFYLRLRWASSNAVEIDMPNGVVHRFARKPNGSSWGANTFNRDELALTNRGDEHPKRPPRHRPSRSTQATQLLGPQPRGWLRIPRKGVAASLAACRETHFLCVSRVASPAQVRTRSRQIKCLRT